MCWVGGVFDGGDGSLASAGRRVQFLDGWAGLLIFSAVLPRSLAVSCSLQGQTIFTLRCSTGFLEDNGDCKLK